MERFRLRSSEWILIGFFGYVAATAPFFRDRPHLSYQPIITWALAFALLCGVAQAERTRFFRGMSFVRDWLPMGLTLIAFREMELFLPAEYNTGLESAWIRLDDIILNRWGLKHALESLGPVVPLYLELCYLLVYGLGTYCVIVLWLESHRREVDRFYVILLTGTLLAYALFPYFPSRPPRIVFPAMDPPDSHNVFRHVNLFLLRKATIHSSVFPSAHVSSAFAAAWGMFLVLPKRKRFGWGLLLYALSVAVATVYGRYHYAADAIAGFGISLVAGALCLILRTRSRPTA